VNFPDAAADVGNIRITSQGARPPGAFKPERRIDGRQVPYYWIRLAYPPGNELPGTDLEAIAQRAISVTPLTVDLSSKIESQRLERAFAALERKPR
jgi:5'-nucleotidase